MRGNELLERMSLIDPAFVEAANETPKKRIHFRIRYVAIAACFTLMLIIVYQLIPKNVPNVDPPAPKPTTAQTTKPNIYPTQSATAPTPTSPSLLSLPMLTISKSITGAGSVGLLGDDISERVNANPWNDALEINTLPVYRNQLTVEKSGIAWGADPSALKKHILNVADKLGIESPTIQFTDYNSHPVPEDSIGPMILILESDSIRIRVDQEMTANVTFDPAISLPEELNCTGQATREDMLAIANYLALAYGDLIGFDDPQISIDGHYNFYGQQCFVISFFGAAENITEQIINYNFNKIEFICNHNGELLQIKVYQPDLSEKVADYPLITLEQAEALLVNGNYITYTGEVFTGKEHIKAVELEYRHALSDEYFIPYYCFYVELLEKSVSSESKVFGTFYVPAVESAYISNMPSLGNNYY